MANKKFIALQVLLLIAGNFTQASLATEIRGAVVEVQGSQVKIEYKSEFSPRPGDNVRIGIMFGEDFIPVEGDWKIFSVSHDFAWAESKNTDRGTPDRGYIAIILAEKPLTRRLESAPAERAVDQVVDPPQQRQRDLNLPHEMVWTHSDLGDNYVWFEADGKCQSLELGGHTDWSLPGIGELETFYSSGEFDRQQIELNGCCAWSADFHQERRKKLLRGTKYTTYAWAFNFNTGQREDIEWTKTRKGEMTRYPGIHVLCVRRHE